MHLKVCPEGEAKPLPPAVLPPPATRPSSSWRRTAKALATLGETVACAYADFHNHFGFFLPLAGITTVKQIRENAFDIKATGRLNRLYIELLKENPDWDTAARRQDLNHFFARLIFCFFAEDTHIFHNPGLFTATIDPMSAQGFLQHA